MPLNNREDGIQEVKWTEKYRTYIIRGVKKARTKMIASNKRDKGSFNELGIP